MTKTSLKRGLLLLSEGQEFKLDGNAEEMQKRDLEIFKILRDKVRHEDTWIQSRISWLLASNAFLFAAYGMSSSDKAVTCIIPFVGFLTALLVLIGLLGTLSAFQQIQNEWKTLIPEDRRKKLPGIRSAGCALQLGGIGSYGLCVVIMLAWAWLIQSAHCSQCYYFCP